MATANWVRKQGQHKGKRWLGNKMETTEERMPISAVEWGKGWRQPRKNGVAFLTTWPS